MNDLLLLFLGYTYDTQQSIDIPDDPGSPPPNDIIGVTPLQSEIVASFRFRFGCPVSTSTSKLYDKFKQIEPNDPKAVELAKYKFVMSKDSSETYKTHVTNSSSRISSRFQNVMNSIRGRTKIQIMGDRKSVV